MNRPVRCSGSITQSHSRRNSLFDPRVKTYRFSSQVSLYAIGLLPYWFPEHKIIVYTELKRYPLLRTDFHNWSCTPTSIIWSGGIPKNDAASIEFFDIKIKRLERNRLIFVSVLMDSFSRPK